LRDGVESVGGERELVAVVFVNVRVRWTADLEPDVGRDAR
jgi:hypothetical protein